jgi:hypothetical protein
MTRLLTVGPLALLVCAAMSVPAAAQMSRPALQPITQVASAMQGELYGVVLDDRGQPLTGAVLSALGSTTAFAVSDRDGRFLFRNLPPGPYLVRAHLQGYIPARGRIIQINSGRTSSTISLTRRDQGDEPQVLAAGVGTTGVHTADADDEADKHDHGEVAWRLRHLKRSVLKEHESGLIGLDDPGSLFEGGPLASLGRAVGTPARYATALFSDLPVTGQINLLTSTAFDRPQDLFTADGLLPQGVAYVSLAAPGSGGDWAMRGALTQGDISSWIVSGSYVRRSDAVHRYEAGLSYGMQRYLGGNADALAATTDGSRNVGSVYAYDNWAINPHLRLGYGAKFARYDYLADRTLLSPRVSVTVKPRAEDSLELRATVSRREVAPGAEEFLPPAAGLWLPPERTFSPMSARRGFTPERIQHMEVAAERQWLGDFVIGLRAFRQRVDDQMVTMFGVALPGKAPASLGHYYVTSGGDLEALGWGVSFSRDMIDGLRASIDYTQTETEWIGLAPDASLLTLVAASAVRRDAERLYDLTTSLESVLPATDTRVFVVYRMNTAFATSDPEALARGGARFELQVNQALPFMNFTSAHWEMLIAVRNLFRDDLLDSSVYDELLVVRPPKRVIGGVTVRF